MNLLQRMGAFVSKPVMKKVELPPAEQALVDEHKSKISAAYALDAERIAQEYARMMPTPVLKKLMEEHDYLCVQWGSRKVARLLNLCRGILDIERHTIREPNESGEPAHVLNDQEQAHVFFLLFWMCWLTPIPIKQYLIRNDVDEHYKMLFSRWLVDEFNVLTADECELVLEGVFFGTMSVSGNIVLDVFHDALRFEEAQFGANHPEETMRTELGKNPVFSVQARRKAASNLTPHWMLRFQEIKGLDGLVSREDAKRDEDYAEQDGISA